VDPACGSGHFLIAAAGRLARHLASVRTGDGEPAPTELRRALRDVIGHCIYGVDLNPMAVELCKVSLWMESLQPGRPLSFLDHRLQCGNSLIGVTPALLRDGIPDEAFQPITGDDKGVCTKYRKINRDEHADSERKIVQRLIDTGIKLGSLATTVLELESVSDDTIEGVREKQRRWEELVRSNDYKFSGLLADAWCAAFVWKKIEAPGHPDPITEATFRRIEQSPWSIIPSPHQQEIERLAQQYQFFHWHLAFPDVFRPAVQGEPAENPAAGWQGGFDVVLGNPPWERIKLQETEWFAQRNPDIATAQKADVRKKMIAGLVTSNPELLQKFRDDQRAAEGESSFLRHSRRYPLCGKGDINTYSIFAELTRTIVNPIGQIGCILQSGIATDDTTKEFFQDLVGTRSLRYLYDFENRKFENRKRIFPGVDSRMKFSLLTVRGAATSVASEAEFVFFAQQIQDLEDAERRFTLNVDQIALLNPNTLTCPVFRTKRDARLTTEIYRRIPILIREGDPAGNPWGIKFMTMLHMANNSDLFVEESELIARGYVKTGNRYGLEEEHDLLPLYEGKMVHHYDHRWAGYAGLETVDVSTRQKQDPSFQVLPRYWVPEAAVEERLSRDEGPAPQWLLGWQDICRSTDERTVI
ncbi:MAG: Eco57I restriction-modification methylase domain-containing protein, partial [Blastocatellia bacterium]